MKFNTQIVNTKKGAIVNIRARSPNKEELLKPAKKIGDLFSPKIIQLDAA